MMDKESFEKRVFELAVSSLSAASGLIDEPPAYGALRVMAMIRDLVEILEEHDLSSLRLHADQKQHRAGFARWYAQRCESARNFWTGW
jgi:hypothetical protein